MAGWIQTPAEANFEAKLVENQVLTAFFQKKKTFCFIKL